MPIGIRTPVTDGDTDRSAWHAAYPQLCGKPYILFLGRIHPKKGIDLLLRSYAAVFVGASQPLLVIAGPVGDDRYYGALRELVSKLAIESRVCWIPMILGSVKWGALRMCEAFVLLSHQENFGVAVVEALACSRPVLVSRQIAISSEIEKAGAGLVAADTVADAIALLERWRELSNPERIAMGQAAQGLFRSQFEIRRAADLLANVIEGVKTSVVKP